MPGDNDQRRANNPPPYGESSISQENSPSSQSSPSLYLSRQAQPGSLAVYVETPLLQQLSSKDNTAGQADNVQACECTQSHAYTSCPRFSEHVWARHRGSEAQGSFCVCPPSNEFLLALGCPKPIEHVQVCLSIQYGPRADCHL
jgi:hypothetical protein